jgi:hypothetical protein
MTGVSFQQCSRSANEVTHELARFAYASKETYVLDGDPPKFILPYLIRDVILLSNEMNKIATRHFLKKNFFYRWKIMIAHHMTEDKDMFNIPEKNIFLNVKKYNPLDTYF